jgi:hypothetical protein
MGDREHARSSGESDRQVSGTTVTPHSFILSCAGLISYSFNSNHGSFYYNQLAAIYLILDNKPAAKAVLQEYFNGIFQNQITATGEQVSTYISIDRSGDDLLYDYTRA